MNSISHEAQELWAILDSTRGEYPLVDAKSIAQELLERNIHLDWRKYDLLVQWLGLTGSRSLRGKSKPPQRSSQKITLDAVQHFISHTLPSSPIERILDPNCTGIALLPALLHTRIGSQGIGLCNTEQIKKVMNGLSRGTDSEWYHSDPWDWFEKSTGLFDLIISLPKLKMKNTRRTWTNGGSVKITDKDENILLVEASQQLKDNGLLIFAVPNNFYRRSSNGVYSNLERVGLNLEAVVHIPTMEFFWDSPLTGNLIFVRKGSSSNHRLFVGQLSTNKERNEILARNLQNRAEGEGLELGRLVDRSEFRGYAALEASDRYDKLKAKYAGFQENCLGQFAARIISVNHRAETIPENSEASIFIHRYKHEDVLLDISTATGSQHYYQIQVNTDLIDPRYLALYLNSPIGREVRGMFSSGTSTQANLNRSVIEQIPIFYPPMEAQTDLVQTDVELESLLNELVALRAQLHGDPKALTATKQRLAQLNFDEAQEERFQDWVESLPFPLASILWTYHTSNGDKDKYEHLLKFFEACAQFMATFLLSGVSQDSLYDEIYEKLQQSFEHQDLSLLRSTFGCWVNIYSTVAKTIRTLWNGNESARNRCSILFATEREALFALATSRVLTSIFSEANQMRNSWQGHGGIVSALDAEERHRALYALLIKLKSQIGNTWQQYQLILPGPMHFQNGIFQCEARLVMGSRTPFETTVVSTDHPLDINYLYFIDQDRSQALQLLPLVRMSSSPATAHNACYFYNRVERDRIRFVSYHFEEQAEQVEDFAETADVLDTLRL